MRMRLRRVKQSKPSAFPVQFDYLKTVWERVALVGAAAYALGYFSRAIHAWDNNFGALPGVRFDYLMAGLFLFLPVAGLAAALWTLLRVGKWLRAWAKRNASRTVAWREKRLPLVSFAALLATGATSLMPDGDVQKWTLRVGLGVLFTVIVTVALLEPNVPRQRTNAIEAKENGSKLGRALGAFFGVLGNIFALFFTAYIGLALVMLFIVAAMLGAWLLAKWPQEFGGVKPKCAVLDLAVDQLSPEAAALLIGANLQLPSGKSIARSRHLEVFSTSGPWLIRVHDSTGATQLRRSLRLPEQTVRSVEWVGRATPKPQEGMACPE
jgi:hypothetical protein